MRKISFTLIAGIIALTGLTVCAETASAANATPRCMTLREWRAIKDANTTDNWKGAPTRAQVTKIVGYAGRKSQTTYYSDGTIDFGVEYRKCGRHESWDTADLWFDTHVIYDANDNAIGVDRTPRVYAKGPF